MNKRKKIASSASFHVFALGLGFIMLYPLLWTLASSFKSNGTMFVNNQSLIPIEWGIADNYRSGWQGISGVHFGRFIFNTLFVASIGTLGGVFSSVMAAYAFARLRFRGKRFWFGCIITTLLVPHQVMVVPQFIIFKRLGLVNTLAALITPWAFGSAFFIFLIIQFMRGIPYDLDEAAKIDGCGKFSTFIKVVLPLAVPAVVTSAIFSFYWIWQDFFQPLIFINKTDLYTVSLALNTYLDPASISNFGGLFAMTIVSLIPVITIFLLFQRYLVEGIATAGLKG